MIDLFQRKILSFIAVAVIGMSTAGSTSVFAQDQEDPNESSIQEDSQSGNQTGEGNSEAFDEITRSIPIEEIVVTAERSSSSIRSQMEQIRNKLFDDYSAVNEVDKYDVDCRKTRWTNSQIPQDFCWPVFFERALADNAQGSIIGLNLLETPANVARQHQTDWDGLRNNVARVANENPEIKEALLEFLRLDAALTRKKQECDERPAFLFVFKLCR